MADDIKEFTALSSTSPAITAQGRLILKYLQGYKDGAKLQDIVQHVAHHLASPNKSGELSKNTELIVGNAATLGFLERKGSKFMCLAGKGACCGRRRRRRRRSSSRRRCRCARRRRRSRRSRRSCRSRRSRRCSRRPRRRRLPRCRCGVLTKALI